MGRDLSKGNLRFRHITLKAYLDSVLQLHLGFCPGADPSDCLAHARKSQTHEHRDRPVRTRTPTLLRTHLTPRHKPPTGPDRASAYLSQGNRRPRGAHHRRRLLRLSSREGESRTQACFPGREAEPRNPKRTPRRFAAPRTREREPGDSPRTLRTPRPLRALARHVPYNKQAVCAHPCPALGLR